MRFYNPLTGKFEGQFPDFVGPTMLMVPSLILEDPAIGIISKRRQKEIERNFVLKENSTLNLLGSYCPADREKGRRELEGLSIVYRTRG